MEFRNAFNDDQQGTLLALDCFKEYCCLICSKFSSQLSQFLCSMCMYVSTIEKIKIKYFLLNLFLQMSCLPLGNQEPTESFNVQLEAFILSFQVPLKISFNQDSDEDELYKKVSLILLEIIQQFVHQLNFQEENVEKVCRNTHTLSTFSYMIFY